MLILVFYIHEVLILYFVFPNLSPSGPFFHYSQYFHTFTSVHQSLFLPPYLCILKLRNDLWCFFFGQSAFVDSFETLGDSFATEGSGRAQKGFLSMVDHSCAGGGWESSVQVCGFSFWHFRSPNCAGRHSLTLLMLALGGLNLIA